MRVLKRRILGGKVIGKLGQLSRRYRDDARSATCRKLVIGGTGALTALLTVIQIAAMPAGPTAVRHPLAQGSVWDSVYSAAQAGRGESTYRKTCVTCHGDSLKGIDDAPPLTGPDFHKSWDGNSLSALFTKINNDMPSDNPGTLTKPQVAEVVAFMLSYNGYPAGAVDLVANADSLGGIKFLPKP
jgi:mono/diheme cytochrome c family protein